MAAWISQEICAQIQNSIDIAEVIGEHVKLKRSSRGYEGLCPFHQERTPSFHVYNDTQSYYCFGCHEAGNIFTFLMKIENVVFQEAVEILAERAGISLPTYEKKTGEKNFYEILDLATKFYAENLSGNSGTAARAYLERRKLDSTDIERFSLGYSPASWNTLATHLQELGISENQMLKADLVLQGKHGIYDKYRGRVIFPIKNLSGKVIAFGGRLIDGEGAKYINSADSEIYSKRKNLYLLDVAKKSIREKRRSILVEGYMDAIRLHKNGFTEAVASLGTSLTAEQAETLSRFADRCYICYDNDTAGQYAAIRGMYILAEHGLDVHVVTLTDGKDPDEFLISNPPEKFEEAIENAKPLVLKHMEVLTPALQDLSTRKSAMKELFESLLKLDISEVMQYKTQLSELTAVPPSKIEEWFTSKYRQKIPDDTNIQQAKPERLDFLLEAGFCALLFHSIECRLRLKPEDISRLLRGRITSSVAFAFLTENPDTLINLWLSMGETDKVALLTRGEEFLARMKDLTVAEKWQKICTTLNAKMLARRLRQLNVKVQKSQATPEELMELRDLKRKISLYHEKI